MGGQACVLYGAAEFSRDTDLAILASSDNLERLRKSLKELQAEVIAVPPFETAYLEKGHAIHFRCHHPEAAETRLDVMSRMRGVDSFLELWARRTTIENSGAVYEVMALPDLVKAKKTQRDKDWPMIRRLVEANYFANKDEPTAEQIAFWLAELRTPSLLLSIASRYRGLARQAAESRALVKHAIEKDADALETALEQEEKTERDRDRIYWEPLKKELEQLRRQRLAP
jgi:hypothetical protein